MSLSIRLWTVRDRLPTPVLVVGYLVGLPLVILYWVYINNPDLGDGDPYARAFWFLSGMSLLIFDVLAVRSAMHGHATAILLVLAHVLFLIVVMAGLWLIDAPHRRKA